MTKTSSFKFYVSILMVRPTVERAEPGSSSTSGLLSRGSASAEMLKILAGGLAGEFLTESNFPHRYLCRR